MAMMQGKLIRNTIIAAPTYTSTSAIPECAGGDRIGSGSGNRRCGRQIKAPIDTTA
jgi:hypothetical protein